MLLTSGSDDGDIGGGCSGAHGWTLRGAIWTGTVSDSPESRLYRAVPVRRAAEAGGFFGQVWITGCCVLFCRDVAPRGPFNFIWAILELA